MATCVYSQTTYKHETTRSLFGCNEEAEIAQFADWILSIGDGTIPAE
jgi:hypothetical protein